MNHVGIDYHKRYSVVCILNTEGEEVTMERIEHVHFERFGELLSGYAPCEVAFEATMNWGWLYDLLEEIKCVERIVMANPHLVRLIAAAQIKTDKVDSRKLARLLRAGMLPASHIPDPITRARKEVLRQRTFWVRERTKVRNRIHRLLGRHRRLEMPQVSDLFGKKGRAALNKLAVPSPDDLLLKQQLAVLDALQNQIRDVEERIVEDGAKDPATGLLSSLPGVGRILGNVIGAEIDGIERFARSEDLVAYSGLIPTTSSSGDKTHHGRLVSACNKWLRWGFVEASWVAVGCSPYFGSLYRRHRARGKKANTAIMIVARRMCQIAFQMLKENRPYEERSIKQTIPGCSPCGRTRPAA